MEPIGAFSDDEFHSLSMMFSHGDADYMLQPHDCAYGIEFETPSLFSSSEANNNVAFLDTTNLVSSSDLLNTTCSQNISDENVHSNGVDDLWFPNMLESMEFYVMENKSIDNMIPVFSEDVYQKNETNDNKMEYADPEAQMNVISCEPHQLKRKSDSSEDSLINKSSDNPKKKSRVSRDSRKKKKIIQECKNDNDENEINGGQIVENSSPSMSEDVSKGSEDLNPNGNTRASKGSSTDSQSLYARKRRERINERLRILQNLVPSGTKVDISTMLEEAVRYVKHLQLQIKLLSSDDLWMYAPIAYNGMDIGSYQKILPYL